MKGRDSSAKTVPQSELPAETPQKEVRAPGLGKSVSLLHTGDETGDHCEHFLTLSLSHYIHVLTTEPSFCSVVAQIYQIPLKTVLLSLSD